MSTLDPFTQLMDVLTDFDQHHASEFYPHLLTWSDGTACQCSVQDPSATDQGYKLAQRLSGLPDVLDVRLLRVRPGDPTPGEGASLPWDGGTLKLVSWGQPDEHTRQISAGWRQVGVTRLTR